MPLILKLNKTGGCELQVREAQEVDLQKGERSRGKINRSIGEGNLPDRRDGFDEETVQENKKDHRRKAEDDPQWELDHG